MKLVGLGLATRLPRERQPVLSPGLAEGSLPCMSPEQTGLTACVLDSRSVLYSLGATLYQLLTGHLLCGARNPLVWLHFHVVGALTSLVVDTLHCPPGEAAVAQA